MSNLIFNYGTMSAGKSSKLLQDGFTFEKNNLKVKYIKPKFDTRTTNTIKSRIGLEHVADVLDKIDHKLIIKDKPQIILIDEIQFFNKSDIDELVILADKYNIIIMVYGLLVDINENLFESSKRLIEVGAKLNQLKTICQIKNCANLANHHIMYDSNNNIVKNSKESKIVGDLLFKSVCRQHYNNLIKGR